MSNSTFIMSDITVSFIAKLSSSIVFLDNIRGAYSDKLLRYLEKRENLYICHLVTTQGNIWGDLDLVIAAEFFSKYLSKVLDYDMAKPDYPEDAMALYRYSRKDLL